MIKPFWRETVSFAFNNKCTQEQGYLPADVYSIAGNIKKKGHLWGISLSKTRSKKNWLKSWWFLGNLRSYSLPGLKTPGLWSHNPTAQLRSRCLFPILFLSFIIHLLHTFLFLLILSSFSAGIFICSLPLLHLVHSKTSRIKGTNSFLMYKTSSRLSPEKIQEAQDTVVVKAHSLKTASLDKISKAVHF